MTEIKFDSGLKNQYRATGVIKGRYLPSQDYPRSGSILTEDGLFPAKLSKKAPIESEQPRLWNCWVRTSTEPPRLGFELKNIRKDGSGEPVDPSSVSADVFSIQGSVAFQAEGKIGVQIHSNQKNPKFDPFNVVMKGELPVDAQSAFWEFEATREGEELVMLDGSEINQQRGGGKGKKKSNKGNKNQSSQTSNQNNKQQQQSNNSQLQQPLIMIEGRKPEVTIKFTERPHLPEQGKKVTLQVRGENGIPVTAEVNRKTLKKQVEKMDSFADWVGALSGKVASISPDGAIELESASMQVFEKKAPKEDKQDTGTPQQAVSAATSGSE